MSRQLNRAKSAALILLLTGCQAPGPGSTAAIQQPAPPGVVMTPAALAQGSQLADRFKAAFHQGGMTEVSSDIERCYATATQPYVQRLPLRECLILDTFAFRLNENVERPLTAVGGMPFYEQPAFARRLGRFGPLAGFTDPAVLGGYVGQGSNTIFSVMASRRRG